MCWEFQIINYWKIKIKHKYAVENELRGFSFMENQPNLREKQGTENDIEWAMSYHNLRRRVQEAQGRWTRLKSIV